MSPPTGTRRPRPPAPPAPRPGRAGFTLVELMVVITIIGLMTTLVYTGSRSLLPRTELRASATDLAGALERARLHAMLVAEPIVFAYDLDAHEYEAYYPYDRGENGERLGPGTFPILDPRRLRGEMRLQQIRLAHGTREEGRLELEVSATGHMPSHEAVLVMSGFEDTQVYTVRALGADPRARVIEGDHEMEVLTDESFR